MNASRPLVAVLAALVVLAGCASTPATDTSASDWPMTRSGKGTHTATLIPSVPREIVDTGPTLESVTVDPADTLVSLPVPADDSPMANLENLFDRIRLGYALPDVDDKAVALQARYFASQPDYLDRTFERAERYLYYVVREIEARNLPLELSMLPVIESAYNPYAYSRARAAGLWQFIAPTATRYQVKVNWWQDGRRDVVDSTRAALDYLSELHTMFDGDWLKAIAAYNCGEQAVQRAVDRNRAAHKPTDFWHLKLPRETRAYVPKLLAMARILANPSKYGLEFASIANKPYFARVDIGSQIDLRVAASLIGASEEELHALNPAFNRWATDPDGPFHLLVPYSSAPEFARSIATLTREARLPVERYTMHSGDTVASIALARELTVPTIRELNGASLFEPHEGDDILLPASRVAPLRAGLIIEGETLLPGHTRKTYVVRHGDTLASIARLHGVKVGDLARLNGLTPHAHLTDGYHLVVEVSDHRGKRRHHRVNRTASRARSDGAPRAPG